MSSAFHNHKGVPRKVTDVTLRLSFTNEEDMVLQSGPVYSGRPSRLNKWTAMVLAAIKIHKAETSVRTNGVTKRHTVKLV